MNNILNESHTQAIGAFVAASILMVYLSYKRWHEETKAMIDKIVHDECVSGFTDKHEVYIHDTLNSLPLAIQQYLRKVLFLVDDYDNGKDYIMNKPLAIIKTMECKQDGSIFNEGTWLNLTAEQVSFASPVDPGFVWSCKAPICPSIPLLRKLNIFARDSYVNGAGELSVSALGLVPLTKVSGTPEASTAELLRWLAEAPFYPTVFLPQSGASIYWVKDTKQMKGPWSEHHGKFVRGQLSGDDDRVVAEVQYNFDEDGLISSIRAYRMKDENDTRLSPWECLLRNYEVVDGMLIPVDVDVGYWIDEKLEVYFKGHYSDFKFKYFE